MSLKSPLQTACSLLLAVIVVILLSVLSSWLFLDQPGSFSQNAVIIILMALFAIGVAGFRLYLRKLREQDREKEFKRCLAAFNSGKLVKFGLRMTCSEGGCKLFLHFLKARLELEFLDSKPIKPSRSIISLRHIPLEDEETGRTSLNR